MEKLLLTDFSKYMSNCPVCGGEIKTIPAGISKKTGKPYESFTSCPNRCRTSWNKPQSNPQPSPNTFKRPTSPATTVDPVILLHDEVQALRGDIRDLINFLKGQ